MPSSLGTLAVNIVASTAGLAKGLRKSKKELKWYEKQAQATTKNIQRAFLKLGAAFTVGAFINGLRKSAVAMDNLAKTSARLGIASEKLAGLRHAANQTGVTTEKLDSSLERFVKRLGEAKMGTGEARQGLAALNLTAKELEQLPLEKKMAVIAERLQGVSTASEKAAIAAKLFGREGVALVNTLAVGAEGLARFQKEAQRLGLAISEKDLKKMEELNDRLDVMGKLFEGEINQILIDIAPAAMWAVKELSAMIGYGTGKKGNEGARKGIAGAFELPSRALGRVLGNNPSRYYQGAITEQERARFRAAPDQAVPGLGMGGARESQQQEQRRMENQIRRNMLMGFQLSPSMSGPKSTGPVTSDHAQKAAFMASLGGMFMGMATTGGGVADLRKPDKPKEPDRMQSAQRREDNTILERGSAAAFKALRANMSGKPQKKLEENTKQTVNELRKVNATLKVSPLTGLQAVGL